MKSKYEWPQEIMSTPVYINNRGGSNRSAAIVRCGRCLTRLTRVAAGTYVFKNDIINKFFCEFIFFLRAYRPTEQKSVFSAGGFIRQVLNIVTDKIGLRKPIQIHVLNKIPLRRKFFIKTA